MIRELVRRLESAEGLDPTAGKVAGVVSTLSKPRPVKNVLSGTWLGHRLHPLLTDVPIGAWVGAVVLDLAGEDGPAARRLVGLGVLAAVPTAASGASDWADADSRQKRVGLIHAAANTLGLVLQAGSWAARRSGRARSGRTLSALGVGAVAAGGYLGGHLSYVLGVGVDHPAGGAIPDWRPALAEADLAEGAPRGAAVDGVQVVLVRSSSRIHALAGTCTHAGAPLADGKVEDECLVCPWHGSRFRLDDGSVVRGPAVTGEEVYEARVVDGRVEVCSRR